MNPGRKRSGRRTLGRPRSQRRATPEGSAEAEATRRRLVEGALTVLARRGLHGPTSREIATASGVNLAGITYHFGSKDELVAQALLQAIRGWLAPALDILRGDGHPALRMIGAVQALQEAF